MIRELARVVPAPPGKPVRAEAAQGQERAGRLAKRPGTWDRQEAAVMRAGFDAAAADWDDSRGSYRRPVLADALARGGPFRPGRAVEIASGAARVMAVGAVLVWSNALGDGAPFFVPAQVLAEAMTTATGHPWNAIHSQAHWGSWVVLRPAEPAPASL